MTHYRTLILGAGAAGLFAAAHAGPGTLVIDHAKRPAEKVRISGGGRCNFTNLSVTHENFLGENAHFPKSALARFTPEDFISRIDAHGIAWHEKAAGQLFCDGKSTQIVDMLLTDARRAGARLWLETRVGPVRHDGARFEVETSRGRLSADHLVLATGGRSIPKMGATGLAYDIARQFGHRITETQPGLVPFTFGSRFATLTGLALPVVAANARARFHDRMLFTHRGMSGPAILQLSSYWHEGEAIRIDLLPGMDLAAELGTQRATAGRRSLTRALDAFLPARLVEFLAPGLDLGGNLADVSDRRLAGLAKALGTWQLTPTGTEGWRTAEVTCGGVATDALSSKTMESRHRPGLFIIGEAVDVTGWLGGYNFHWAWASAHAAAVEIAARR